MQRVPSCCDSTALARPRRSTRCRWGKLEKKRPTHNSRLRRARTERSLTQADVAEYVGTSILTVSRWELGVQSPQPHYREKLCRLYGMSALELGLVPGAVANGRAATAEAEAEPVEPAPAEWPRDDLGSADALARRDLLAQVRRYWIDTELRAATPALPSLELALVEQRCAVDDPLRTSDRPEVEERPLPRGARIADVHHQLGQQLLILGDPGAGKTTLLLQLANELLTSDRERPPEPMPVVFHLASWASDRGSLDCWLATELHQRYGVSRPLGRQWIEDEQIMPLLDGLDEVAEKHREACITAINAFHRDHGQLPMAVCCRTAWYEGSAIKLALRGAVMILPLTQIEVRQYLSEYGEQMAGVQSLLAGDEQMRELLTTPLFLTIAALAYRDRPAASIGEPNTLAERRRQVLDDYVDARLSRSNGAAPYPRERTLWWLSWLARAMRDHDQSVFYLDWIQPGWLRSAVQRRVVTHGMTAAVGLASGLLVGINWGGDWGASLGAPPALLIGGTAGLLLAMVHAIVAHESRIAPAEQLRWSWSALRTLPRWLAFGLAIGLSSGLVFGLALGVALDLRPDALSGPRSAGAAPTPGTIPLLGSLLVGTVSGIVNGAGFGLLIGLTLGLFTSVSTRPAATDMAPGRSVEASGRTALVAGAIGACVFGMGFGLTYGVGTNLTGPLVHQAARALHLSGFYWPVAAPNDILVAVLVGGIASGLQRGGGAYLRHRALVWMLALSDCAPRDYAAFLEYAARLILLQRRGGGYEFVHRVLLDYFAELEPPATTSRLERYPGSTSAAVPASARYERKRRPGRLRHP
jgi:transcriptional regulator with XRE-family HTH domain